MASSSRPRSPLRPTREKGEQMTETDRTGTPLTEWLPDDRLAGVVERFWAKVQRTSTCWLWTGSKTVDGYGHLGIGHLGKRRAYRAHRFAYELSKGPIPKGLVL